MPIPKQQHSARSPARHALELLVGVVLTAIVLHSWYLAGLIAPIEVSGGSMAPALPGPRREAACERCGWPVVCGHERLPADGIAVCPNCAFSGVELAAGADRRGERVWIDRAAYLLGEPQRWDVAVFRCPEQPGYCVKRIVGLPGEEVWIHDGNVYVDGKIARKAWRQVEAQAQMVFDASFRTTTPSDDSPKWMPEWSESAWREVDAGWVYAPGVADVGGARPAGGRGVGEGDLPAGLRRISAKRDFVGDFLVFHPRNDAPVDDDCGYNQSESRRLHPVRDLIVEFRLEAEVEAEWSVFLHSGGDRFDVLAASLPRRLEVRQNGEGVFGPEEFSVPQRSHVAIAAVDQQLFVVIDGAVAARKQYEPGTTAGDFSRRPIGIAGRGGRLEIRDLRVLRDVYYTLPPRTRWGESPVRLGAGEFFVLGDNSPISHDSRSFRQPPLPRKLLLGKALGVQ